MQKAKQREEKTKTGHPTGKTELAKLKINLHYQRHIRSISSQEMDRIYQMFHRDLNSIPLGIKLILYRHKNDTSATIKKQNRILQNNAIIW